MLPKADEVDLQISPEDVRVDIFHASGAGGQNVNKVATAVRMVHVPTGTVAVCQDERSQFKNKQKAMSILRARLYEAEQQRQDTQITQARRAQVGTGERAEKIRTYNFPQDRISDHRLRESLHGIQKLLAGEMGPAGGCPGLLGAGEAPGRRPGLMHGQASRRSGDGRRRS